MSFVARLMGREFINEYEITIRREIHHLVINTNRGVVKFELWDIPGQEKAGELPVEYYEKMHAAIIVFDLHARFTYSEVKKWYVDICRDNRHVPFVIIANKADGVVKMREKHITFHLRKPNVTYKWTDGARICSLGTVGGRHSRRNNLGTGGCHNIVNTPRSGGTVD